jgi:putative polymerase
MSGTFCESSPPGRPSRKSAERASSITAERAIPASWLSWDGATLAGIVLVSAVLLNPVLAILNGHVLALGGTHVAIAEACVVGAAGLIVFTNAQRAMAPWLLLALVLVTIQLFLVSSNQVFVPKYFRDVLLIPLFICLGMVFSGRDVVRLFCAIQAVVLAFLLLEAFALDVFASIFQVVHYYINTRGFTDEQFWNPDSPLFVSATRPEQRFLLPWLNLHRMSSIFLEPVSLGNYCVISTAFILSLWQRIGARTRAFMVVSTIILLIGSDGRLATGVCAVLLAGAPLFPRLPRWTAVLYLPATLLLAVICVDAFGWSPALDDFEGRTARSVNLLYSLTIPSVFGLDSSAAITALDTGIAYFLITQSLPAVVLVWVSVSFSHSNDTRASAILVHSICIYVALNLLVSYSLFSIKTAAPIWFLYGVLLNAGRVNLSTPSRPSVPNSERGSE